MITKDLADIKFGYPTYVLLQKKIHRKFVLCASYSHIFSKKHPKSEARRRTFFKIMLSTKKHELKSHIFKLISSHQWSKLQIFVLLHRTRISKLHDLCSDDTCHDKSRQNALQYALYNRPPLQAIKCLYSVDPRALHEKDCQGNYPLHIACARGCSPAVIKFLLKKYPQAALKTEMNDRTPFLLACKSYLWNNQYSQEKWNIANRDLLEVLHSLTVVSGPTSMTLDEDCDGKSPLDYLLETDAREMVSRYVYQLISIVNGDNDSNYIPPKYAALAACE